MDTTLPKTGRRLVELDGLRGLAALSVLLFHYTTKYDEFFGHQGDPLFSFSKGSLGVELFFIISGFVILMTIGRTESIRDFVVSRFGRLYPAYWVAIFLTFAIVSATSLWPEGQPSMKDVVLNLTMVQGFLGGQNVDGVYWTLQTEVLFYGLIGALFIFRLIRHVEFVAIGLLVLSVVDWLLTERSLLPAGIVGSGINDLLTLILVGRSVEYFVTGMMLYLCWKHGVTKMRLAIIAFAVIVTPLGGSLLATGTHVGFVVLVGLTTMGVLTPLRSRPFIFLGYISYTLYLLHQFIGYVVIHEAEQRGVNSNVAIVCAAAVAIGLATVVTLCVERPAMAFIKGQYKAMKSTRLIRTSMAHDSVV